MGRRTITKLPSDPASVGWTRAHIVRLATEDEPFDLELGGILGPVDVEYETYGQLSVARDNVILVEHALSMDAHVAGWDSAADETGRPWRKDKPGWWDAIVGPGEPIDTSRYFVICCNVLGGCYGTTGPASTNPASGKPYGLSFPLVTVGDWVRLQCSLLNHLGIEQVHTVVGGSLGGNQAMEWALAYPDRVRNSIVMAASPRLSTQGLAFNFVGRRAIMTDSRFQDGNYYETSEAPEAGLSVARMMAHITYLSEEQMRGRHGRRLQDEVKERPNPNFDIEFAVEGYLAHQGQVFVERFDANSYLYISRAMDFYDAAEKWGGEAPSPLDLNASATPDSYDKARERRIWDWKLVEACRRIQSRMCLVSFSSDWLYPPAECHDFAMAMCRAGRSVTYVNVPADNGHDSFLVKTREVGRLISGFIDDERA